MNLIKRFKSLPIPARRQLSLGIVIAFTVALPLFVWAIVSQKFLINQKAQTIETIGQKTSKVLVIEFNPTLTGGTKLNVDRGWNDPAALEQSYVQDLKNLSGNYVDYQIVQRIIVDEYPMKADGFAYTESSYLGCLNNHSTCHSPDLVDYLKIVQDYQVCDRVNSDEINELWIWGGPWFGYYEAMMAGPTAFNTNAPPLTGTSCNKDLHVMGFNYERALSEMIENFGHRFEGTMIHAFTSHGIDLWTNFTKYDQAFPGQAACGNVHFPPNATSDYDWTNTNSVGNTCEDWLNYPNLSGTTQTFNCQSWGCSSIGWKEYWLSHIPKATSYSNGTWNNWWKYVLDYQEAINSTPTPTATPTVSPTASPTESPTGTMEPSATPTPTATPSPTPDPTGTPNPCNGTCGSHYNCQSGLFCNQGFCRNPFCPSDSKCTCLISNTSETPTPSPAISKIKNTPSPQTTEKPFNWTTVNLSSPSPTSSPIAEVTPKTNMNFLLWFAGGSFSTAIILLLLAL